MKLCKDCKHNAFLRFCISPINMISPVTGNPVELSAYLCRSSELRGNGCGPEAKHFEVREERKFSWRAFWNAL